MLSPANAASRFWTVIDSGFMRLLLWLGWKRDGRILEERRYRV
jgi:hypothetical protein